ncbi:MAG: competence/damage-inducible protein A [Gemmatimonadota bacterium]|jgi:nicotinamide-nucleotide amidase|nr:competence/damage-inducible protein A [Gemmatimonadota bacterium]
MTGERGGSHTDHVNSQQTGLRAGNAPGNEPSLFTQAQAAFSPSRWQQTGNNSGNEAMTPAMTPVMKKAAILAIGDEIVAGLTTDTNSGYIARLLRGAGIDITGFFSVADVEDEIIAAFRRALEDADIVISTGGLGPTADDLTVPCLARLAGVPLEMHEPSLRAIEERFRSMGVEMPENNRKQALLPQGAEAIFNPTGTAPGTFLRLPGDRYVVSLPGVPRETIRMLEETVVPRVAELAGAGIIASCVFSTVGLSESKLDELLVGSINPAEGRLSFRAAFPKIQARVTAWGRDPAEVEERLGRMRMAVADRLGDHLYAIGDTGLEEEVGRLLRDRGATLALAESCTGGLIGHRITDVPGSSEYFLEGIIAYSNEAKIRDLGVSAATLEREGAVSEAVVREMARGVRLQAGASLGLATSGVAGPGGGSPEKPVGTVCIGIATEEGEWSRIHHLAPRSRGWVKEMTAQIALDMLRSHLAGLRVGS